MRYDAMMVDYAATTAYWVFQLINAPSALGLMLTPKRVHESMFTDPTRVYKILGFSSPTAVEMVHNVLRGQGAALLAISAYLFAIGSTADDPKGSSSLLIALTCNLSAVAHALTLRHHLGNAKVREAIGSLGSLYGMIATNLTVGGVAFVAWLGA
jgi:hypothetical protein